LRVIIASGKFHGVMHATTPIGCLIAKMRLSACVPGDAVAVDALGLFAEPFEERRGVRHLALALGERLALLHRHQLRQVVLVLQHQVEPLAQHGGALFRGLLAPRRQRAVGGFDRLARLGGAELRHGAHDLAGGRVVHVDGGVRAGVHPRAVDVAGLAEQLFVREGDAGRSGGRHEKFSRSGGPEGPPLRTKRAR
jgi:hypothetical protein